MDPAAPASKPRLLPCDLEDHVHFIGEVDEDLLVDCYRAADLSVVPS